MFVAKFLMNRIWFGGVKIIFRFGLVLLRFGLVGFGLVKFGLKMRPKPPYNGRRASFPLGLSGCGHD